MLLITVLLDEVLYQTIMLLPVPAPRCDGAAQPEKTLLRVQLTDDAVTQLIVVTEQMYTGWCQTAKQSVTDCQTASSNIASPTTDLGYKAFDCKEVLFIAASIMANKLLVAVVLACLAQHIQSQTFTRKERDQILQRHRLRLDGESLQLFEEKLKGKDENNFRLLMNYDGIYEELRLGNVTWYSVACSEHIHTLVGIDYKRHNDRHYLLCFSPDTLLIRTFNVFGAGIQFDSQYHSRRVDGRIKHALFYRHFNTDRLFVAALIQKGVFSIKTFEVLNNIVPRELSHEFQLGEHVVRIDSLSYGLNRHKLVALTAGDELKVNQDGDIVKMSMPRASQLTTLRIQTQGFIISSNTSHWCAFRYEEQGPEFIVMYRSNSLIVDLKTMINSDYRHYVVVVAQFDQMIYRWDGATFRGNAKMRLRGVYKMNPLSVSYMREDNLFYFDQHDPNGTIIYGYDNNRRQFTKLAQLSQQQLNLPNLLFKPNYGNHFSQRQTAFELKIHNSMIFVFAYHTYIMNTDRRETRADITGLNLIPERTTMEHKLNNMLQAASNFEKTETISKTQVNMTFTFDVQFQTKIATKRLEVQNERAPERWIINKKSLNGGDVLIHLHELRQLIPLARERSHKVKHELDSEVVYKFSNGVITGFKEFVNNVVVPRIDATSSYVDFFRGQYVSELLSKLYRTSTNVRIGGTKVFAVDTKASTFMRVNRLNKARLEDFLYGSFPQDVYSDFWYRRLHIDRLNLGDQLAPNVSLSKAVFINQNGNPPVAIQNRIIFSDLDVNHLRVDKIDHLWMNKLPGQVLRKSMKQKVQSFRIRTRMNSLNARSDVFTDYLNGVNSSLVFANLVRRSGVVHFNKPVRINGDARFRFLNSDGKLNGIRVPDDLLDRYSDQTIRGIKKFSQLSIKNLQSDTLNNLRIPNDIITLSRDEVIPGHLSVDALRVGGNLQVDGLVDRINMTHLDQRYISTLQNNYHNLTFYKPVYVKWLKVKGHSNGVNIEDIYNDSVFNNSHVPVHIPSTKTITSMLRCESLNADQVNGQNTSQFVTTFEPAFFLQRVTFKQHVQFDEVKLRDTLDGVSINEILENVASLKGQHVIFGKKSFKETVHVDNLIVHGSINRIRPDNFMLYGAEQNITGRTSFSHAQIGRLLSLSNLQLTGNLNNLNFGKMSGSLIWFNKPRSLDIAIYCGNCSASHIETLYINGKNFTYFQQNYLSKSRPQTIRGNKNFKGVQQFVELKTRHGMVAGINMTRIHQDAITLHGHNVIRHPVIIHDDLKLRNGRLTTEIFNQIDVNGYYQKAVRNNLTEVVQIHGRIIFGKGFDLHADMTATKLNEVPPEKLFMTTTGNYTIRTNVHFAGKVVTSGNVKVNTHINGIDLVRLDLNILKVNEQGEVNGSINFLQNVTVGEIAVAGLVDGIPVDRESVLMAHSQQNLNQMVLNGPVHFQQNVNVWATINGFQQDNLNKIVMANSMQKQVINASKTFHHVDAAEIRQLKGDVHIKVINGVNLREFEHNAVYSNSNRTMNVKQHFLQNVTLATRTVSVSGRVNNIDLLAEVIRLDFANQTITGIKTFERVNLNDDIDVHGRVNALDLPLIQQSVLYNVGQQSVTNAMTFKAPIYLASDSQVDRLNHIEPSHLLTLNGNQQVNGQLRFGQMKVEKVASKYVNNVNLTEITEHVLYKNSPKLQKVHGTIIVNNARFDDDVNLKYHLNQVDLNVAVEAAKTSLNQKFDVKQVAQTIERHTNKLHNQRTQYEYASFEIEYLLPSHLHVDNSVFASKFDYLLDHKVGRNVFDQVATSNPSAIYQPFIFKAHAHVAVIEFGQVRPSLRIQYTTWDYHNRQPIFETAYVEQYLPNFQPLVFVMDDSMYILYGSTDRPDCLNQTQSYLKRLTFASSHIPNAATVVQQFNEKSVLNLGHFADENGYHYLVFNSQSSGLERQIKVYKRFGQCLFELLQTIEASNVQVMAVFKFGLPGLVEQYLATLSSNKLTLWKQQGILGFSQRWSVRAAVSQAPNLPMQLLPFVRSKSQLFIYSPSCPVNVFEAVLNGHFVNLQLFYDDYY